MDADFVQSEEFGPKPFELPLGLRAGRRRLIIAMNMRSRRRHREFGGQFTPNELAVRSGWYRRHQPDEAGDLESRHTLADEPPQLAGVDLVLRPGHHRRGHVLSEPRMRNRKNNG